MSIVDKLKARTAEIAASASQRLESLKTDEHTRVIRINICHECPSYVKSTSTCKQCGCFMSAKTWIASAKCPLDKW